MTASQFQFDVLAEAVESSARRGRFHTSHGPVDTPAFMPVGTQGTVKGMTLAQLRATGAQMILGNTYHLALRPGHETVAALGGLHKFGGWEGPILTDSGGFQLFSLAHNTKVTETGSVFRSHIDGKRFELAPEDAVRIQEALGSDVAMVLDHVVQLPSPPDVVRDATQRTVRWAKRCQLAHQRPDQAQFAIVQGGLDPELRVWCAKELASFDFPGYAIGGLSVGETPEQMYEMISATVPAMPRQKPRYLMGVGRPEDILEAVRRGVDLFDCVMPTRNGRNATVFSDRGVVRLRNQKHARDERPIEEGCPCPACHHSLGYLRHLFLAKEMLGPILATAHNLTYYQRLMSGIRAALEAGQFESFYHAKFAGWRINAAEQV